MKNFLSIFNLSYKDFPSRPEDPNIITVTINYIKL